MLFPTFEFAIFFLFVFLISWLIRKNRVPHRLFLIAASFFFYGYWNWRYAFLLFACCIGNYAFALLLEAAKKRAKLIFIAAMVYNLGILVFFKYYLFFTVNANNLFLALGANARIPVLPIVLPVGISFFTFQGMSYTIDVYRKEYPAARSLLDVLLYISFFPQLVAGPIVRGGDFLPQLKRPPNPKTIEVGKALVLIIGGLVKKVFVAQYLAILLVDPVFASPLSYSWLESLLAVYGYAFQIFCDFSAYSDIAIGAAALLGYRFPPNFIKPYAALGIQDFWRRWHISLSTWLKDYLYISLGGNKRGKLKTYRNLVITMLLGGMWHGAAWNFIFWGGLHGTGLALERLFAGRGGVRSGKRPGVAGRFIRIVLTFHFVCLGWIFFRSSSFGIAWDYLKSFGNPLGRSFIAGPFVILLLVIGMGMHFIPLVWEKSLGRIVGKLHWAVQAACLTAVVFLLSSLSPEGVAPFIYFQF